MKINTSDKLIAWLTLLSGLSISAVAVWYSVAGLVSIFAAAAIPIMIMGVTLEVSKLVATVWLKMNWSIAPKLIRTYLIVAITILMLITSMGIFGFLSKAHLDQAVPTGDVVDKVALIDEKIKTQRENIDAARKALKQMDESVDQTMARSADEKGADKAAALRRGQQRERGNLQNDIAKAQKAIGVLNEERAPIAKELRKVEAEVGPIKYIAALLYGDSPDQNLLEKAVRWVIIIIVIVFDPLAVILLLASQYSFQWFRKQEEDDEEAVNKWFEDGKERARELDKEAAEQAEETIEDKSAWPQASAFWPFPAMWKTEETKYEQDDGPLTDEQIEQIQQEANKDLPTGEIITQEQLFENSDYKNALEDWNQMIAEAEKAVEQEKELEDHELIDQAVETEKQAMTAWKHDNPDSSLKSQRKLFDNGIITKLPWEDYLKPKADFSDNEAAEEAAKWALEQLDKKEDESKKKDSGVDGDSRRTSSEEEQRDIGYVQNAEQGEQTLWQRIKKGS
jgi:5-bromo-4-chloroindolyl phosphate hydrolysis protein